MGERRRKFDADFREGAVRLVRETGKPIAQVARRPGINEGTLGNWLTPISGAAVRVPGHRWGQPAHLSSGNRKGRQASSARRTRLPVRSPIK